MVGQGTGPSRRSHTKSRKGCKTCKRRHIRCDETFPQCRNCTKHQVRCDYMESIPSDSESQSSPEQAPALVLTPGTESRVELWQQTGSFPYPDLQVFPQPQSSEYSKVELGLLHHLSKLSNELMLRGSNNLTIWTHKVPKFMGIASQYPYVMHALLSFSANHLAWTRSSADTRNLHIQHGTIALRGLHDAIGNFSTANADAVLAASLLLLWQATDWRSWSSLSAGIQSVVSTMGAWKGESAFADFIDEGDVLASSHRSQPLDASERSSILQNTFNALQRLQSAIAGAEVESYWVGQFLAYIRRLQVSNPARTPEEQFTHLYMLRKWMFWVPTVLLQRQTGQGPAMLTIAHLYATAIALEPLFPDLGSAFCAKAALVPLENIINVTDAMRSEHGLDQSSMEIASLMQFPLQTAIRFRSSIEESRLMMSSDDSQLLDINAEILNYSSIGNMSPAFAPSPVHYAASGNIPSSSNSPYLEVPTPQSGFSYGTQSWGTAPSPGFPPQVYPAEQEQQQCYGYMSPFNGFHGGFVPPTPIWT